MSFLFSSRDLLDALVAESQILFEVKCIDKYSSDFVVQTDDAPALSTDKIGYQLSFELQEYIAQDGVFDKLKGLVVAYTQSVAFGSNRQEEEISRMLRELKNAFTSLNTQIMMSESVQPSSYGCRSLIAQCRASFDKTTDRKTNLFDILFQQLSEIDNLSKLRFSAHSLPSSSLWRG